jgi:hypothetical protein
MADIFNARVLVHPSFIEPDLIITTSQASGFMDLLAERALRVKLGPVDKFVYQNRIDLRTQVTANQASANLLPSSTIVADYVQTATYRVRTRAEYNELDLAEAGEWNVALPAAQRLAMRQGIFQYIRVAALFGVNAANSEGLLNVPNSTQVNLPPDSYGNTTILTYDPGQLAQFFLGQILAALQRLYYLGAPTRVAILGPQRIIGQMQLVNIVQLTSYQRPGAGTGTTAQLITEIAKEFGIEIEWAYDDTLAGVGGNYGGASGSDAVLMVVPEAIVPSMDGIDTNVFNALAPNQKAMTLQYADVAAPVEITTPIPEGLDVVSQMRISSGWAPRGQAVTTITIPY